MERVTEHADRGRFELPHEGETAFVSYRVDGNRVVLLHTEVPRALSGKGVGSHLAKGVLDIVRESGRKAVVHCAFIAEWVRRHPDYADLVEV